MNMNFLRIFSEVVGSSGLEPPTSRLSGARSNHLSYEPIQFSVASPLIPGGDRWNRTLPNFVRRQIRLSHSVSQVLVGFAHSFSPTRLYNFSNKGFCLSLKNGGDDGNRTHDPLLAGQVLSQLSYTPILLWDLYRSLKIEQQQIPYLDLSHFPSFVSTRIQDIPLRISHVLHRKEVIQPHLPIRLPCYDLTPIIEPTFDCCPLAVSPQASGVSNFHGLTGGVYKARERIHRGMLIRDY